jgi:hypothetical protein
MATRKFWHRFGHFTMAMALALPFARAEESRAIDLVTYQSGLLEASGHPNELNRWHGLWAYENGRVDEARGHFERAAAYGDKLSQHVLTLMYWNGDDGFARDPALAYVWADLAAERGNSHDLLGLREKIWNGLTPAQRSRALEIGPGYYARYGDAMVQKRTHAALRRFMRNQTGTRVGMLTSRLDISMGRPDLWAGGGSSSFGEVRSTGTEYYAAHRTRPDAYWKAEDKNLHALLRQIGAGKVVVGEASKVSTDGSVTGDPGDPGFDDK